MSTNAEKIVNEALQLKAAERASVAEAILLSLNVPGSKIDAAWAAEADARIESYKRGELGSTSADKVFAKYKN